jgi:hypothetical protein
MSVPSYEGKTYVGYLDISGFKQIMKHKNKVERVLDEFYSTLYNTVCDVNSNFDAIKMNVVAVSDCAVLFLSKGENDDVDQNVGLPKMLQFIKHVNLAFINRDSSPFMTTCSIAYGDFKFENRKDSEYIRKNCLRGPAYVEAYLDNEKENEKMTPGKCRILKRGLSIDLRPNGEFALLEKEKQYYYYYWMLNNSHEISPFKKRYDQTFEEMYDKLKRLLRSPTSQ